MAEGFSFFVAVCFTVNYIMGCGFLGVPEAFVDAGVVLGSVLMALFAFLCNITKDYLLEAMARMEALTRVNEERRLAGGGEQAAAGSGGASAASASAVVVSASPLSAGPFKRGDFAVTDRKFELTDITDQLMGRGFKVIYVTILCLYMYGALWAYTAVFGASMAANVPLTGKTCNVEEDSACETEYRLWLLIFAVIVIPLSCMDLQEQVSVQVTMSVARVVVVLFMVGSLFVALGCDGYAFSHSPGPAQRMHAKTYFKPSGLSTLMPVAVYASIFHHSIPVLAQPVRDKSQLKGIFACAFAVTASFYIFIGVTIGMYFGEDVDKQCNLDWEYYLGCSDTSDDSGRSTAASIIRFVILIFPALDVMSAFPLNAITLGNNILVSAFGDDAAATSDSDKERLKQLRTEQGWRMLWPCCSRTQRNGYMVQVMDEVSDAQPSQDDAANDHRIVSQFRTRHWRKIGFRLLAVIPPMVGAAFKHNLETILDYAGTVGVLLAFVVPPVLWYASVKRCNESVGAWNDAQTGSRARKGDMEHYTDFTSSPSNRSAAHSENSDGLLSDPSKEGREEVTKSQKQLMKTPYDSLWSLRAVVFGTGFLGVGVFLYILVELAKG